MVIPLKCGIVDRTLCLEVVVVLAGQYPGATVMELGAAEIFRFEGIASGRRA